jgi:hypothetical protein
MRSVGPEKVFLIVDSHPVHKASKVRSWIDADPVRCERLKLFYLPGYAPELNPDECVNQDTKQAMKKHRPRDQGQLIGAVRSHLSRRQKQPGGGQTVLPGATCPLRGVTSNAVK